jgi:hypothetical protein
LTRYIVHVIISTMSALAGPLPPSERLAFCASIAREIAQSTATYYDPEATHAYLRSPNGGGTLRSEEVTEDSEYFSHVSVGGLVTGDFLTEELLTDSGLPEGITPDGIVWSIITDRTKFPVHMRGEDKPDSMGISRHSWNYWDGRQWHTSISTRPGRETSHRAVWVSSVMVPEERMAMKAVTRQVRGVHQITEVYEGDTEQLEQDMSQVEVDPEARKWLNVAFASAIAMRKEVEASGKELRNFMPFYSTGYQRIGQLADRIALVKQADAGSVQRVNGVGTALANMYRGSAVIQRDSMRKRAYRARINGHPLPLPAAW